MNESEPTPVTVSFECPVCDRMVKMTNSQQHNLTSDEEYHSSTSVWDSDYDCPVYFRDNEREIRQVYDFIKYPIPPIFIQVPSRVTEHDIFRAVMDATVTHKLGVRIEVKIQDDDGNRAGVGRVYGWYHGNKPSYYGVTVGLQTPQNVIVTESRKEFAEFLERWYYHNKEHEKPDNEYRDYKPDPENQSLKDF